MMRWITSGNGGLYEDMTSPGPHRPGHLRGDRARPVMQV